MEQFEIAQIVAPQVNIGTAGVPVWSYKIPQLYGDRLTSLWYCMLHFRVFTTTKDFRI